MLTHAQNAKWNIWFREDLCWVIIDLKRVLIIS